MNNTEQKLTEALKQQDELGKGRERTARLLALILMAVGILLLILSQSASS